MWKISAKDSNYQRSTKICGQNCQHRSTGETENGDWREISQKIISKRKNIGKVYNYAT